MDKRRTNQLLGLSRDVISTTWLQFITLWEDTWKEWGSYLTTSDVDAYPLRKRRLLCTFFVSARLLLGVDIGYLAPHFLSAWWNYHLLISRIWLCILNFLAGYPAWGNRALMCSTCADLSSLILEELCQYRNWFHPWRDNELLCALKWALLDICGRLPKQKINIQWSRFYFGDLSTYIHT